MELDNGGSKICKFPYVANVHNYRLKIRQAALSCEDGVNLQWDTFCFIATDAVLIPDTVGKILHIYKFTEKAFSLRRGLALELLSCVSPFLQIEFCSEPPPRPHYLSDTGEKHGSCAGQRFVADPEAAIVVITVDYMYDNHGMEIADTYTLVVHRSSLLDLAVQHNDLNCPQQKIPWDRWGPEATRWGVGTPPAPWGYYIYGQRYVAIKSEGEKYKLLLYDFNVLNTTGVSRDVTSCLHSPTSPRMGGIHAASRSSEAEAGGSGETGSHNPTNMRYVVEPSTCHLEDPSMPPFEHPFPTQ